MQVLRNIPVDPDPQETREWVESLDSVFRFEGSERTAFLLAALNTRASELGVLSDELPFSAYRNTIPAERQPSYPGDLALEERTTAIIRWNALAMVVRANLAAGELGGHIASYASAAEIFEIGFNHFFRGAGDGEGGDLVFFQPHSAPGVYARAFLEGRLSEENLQRYRREIGGAGLSSYPHPWLMPDFWQMPTGSMGIGPISAIYQARFMRYLAAPRTCATQRAAASGVCSAMARWTSRNRLPACRSQLARGSITSLLSSTATSSGSTAPCAATGKSSRSWSGCSAAPAGMSSRSCGGRTGTRSSRTTGRMRSCAVSPRRSTGSTRPSAPRTVCTTSRISSTRIRKCGALVSRMSDREIDSLKRGGHDFRKLYAAFEEARTTVGRPTVILAKTKKGYGMGGAGESRMIAAPDEEA